MDLPETRYAKSGNIHIAYQVVGEGEVDLVYVPGFVSNLDLNWEEPDRAYFYSRLAAFSRLILFDKRGTGLNGRRAGRYGCGGLRARGSIRLIRRRPNEHAVRGHLP
jgi:pimeloyl-ACP methyl ester carboxylesterase